MNIAERFKEVGSMKKTLFTIFFICLSLAFISGTVYAATGPCSDCHTMHNKQNGADVDAGGPYARLLKAGCVSCHSAAAGQSRNGTNGPAVLHTSAPAGQGNGATHAGGDFWWVAADHTTGHNVSDIGTPVDTNIGETPPGWDPDATSGNAFGQVASGAASWGANQLTCAGEFGCHGNHTAGYDSWDGIQGSHHSDVTGLLTTADTVGNSFRFLGGIKGYEDADWQWSVAPDDHNEYYGVDSPDNRQYNNGTPVYANTDTISYLCAECHGEFHSLVADTTPMGAADPWRRHPTDIVLPNAGEYASYNPDGGVAGEYNVDVPVARPLLTGVDGTNSTVAPGDSATINGAIVMCLSCHRAHGSDESDLLRFTYNMQAEVGTTDNGCFVCHTEKNAD